MYIGFWHENWPHRIIQWKKMQPPQRMCSSENEKAASAYGPTFWCLCLFILFIPIWLMFLLLDYGLHLFLACHCHSSKFLYVAIFFYLDCVLWCHLMYAYFMTKRSKMFTNKIRYDMFHSIHHWMNLYLAQ